MADDPPITYPTDAERRRDELRRWCTAYREAETAFFAAEAQMRTFGERIVRMSGVNAGLDNDRALPGRPAGVPGSPRVRL